MDSCAEIESAPSVAYIYIYITNSGRVWRKVPESDARSAVQAMSTGDQSSTSGPDAGIILNIIPSATKTTDTAECSREL